MARLGIELPGISGVGDAYPAFVRWDRHLGITTTSERSLIVSAVTYKGTQLFDNGFVDSNYDLADPLPSGATTYTLLFFNFGGGAIRNPVLTGLNMKITWEGGAAVSAVAMGGDANNNQSANIAGKYITFTFKATAAAPQGGTCTNNSWVTFTFTGTSGPPTNIKIFKVSNEAIVDTELFDPDSFDYASQWSVLRCMDVQRTNDSEAIDYTDLATMNFRAWGLAGTSSGQKCGVPVEVLSAIANQSGRPIWVNIPHKFTDAAIATFAAALRDGTSQMVYVEYSNEVWNGLFAQKAYAQSQGALISDWSASSVDTQGKRWSGLRAAKVSSIFRSVYGTDSGNRWTGVLCTQLGSTGVIAAKLVGVDYFLNPAKSLLQPGDTNTTLFSHIGVAPYFGPTPSDILSEPGLTMKDWVDADDQDYFNAQYFLKVTGSEPASANWKNIAHWRVQWLDHMTTAAGRGWTVAMYEGGFGSVCLQPTLREDATNGPPFNLAIEQFSYSEENGRLHHEIFSTFLADGGVLPLKFAMFSQRGKFGSWGILEDLDDPKQDVHIQLDLFNRAKRRIRGY